MPPKVTKKRQLQISSMKQCTIAEVDEKVQMARDWLQAKRDEMLREAMTETIDLPKEILEMNVMDFLKREDFSEFFDEPVENIKEEAEEEMEYEEMGRCSALSKETDIPTIADGEMTPDRAPMPSSRVLQTPCGVSLPVPAVIRLKVENDQDNMYRKPHADEEIAFSIHGSPMVIQNATETDAEVENIRQVLHNIGDQSPDSRALAETVQKLLRKKIAKKGGLKPKQEEGEEDDIGSGTAV